MKLFVRVLYLSLISLILFCLSYLPSFSLKKAEHSKGLNIFVWGDFFPEETFRKFEKETGIKLTINNYTSNEELILKLEKTRGVGFDLIFPSDYAVSSLIQKGLIKSLDREKLPFWNRIEPCILDGAFDPANKFSIPYFWEIYGLAIEKKKISPHFKPTLSHLFEGDHKVVMMQDPVEAVSLASHYLYGYKKTLSPNEIEAVFTVLRRQKNFIEAYTDHRTHYLISSEDSPAAILRSSFFFKSFDDLPHIEFFPPQNGTFVTIENVAISTASEHLDEAYQFINFIYRPEIMALQLDEGPLFPACKDALPFVTIKLAPDYYRLLKTIPNEKLYFFNEHLVPSEKIRPLWCEVIK